MRYVVLIIAGLFFLSACEEKIVCGDGNKDKCCKIDFGDGNVVSQCVANCNTCIELAGTGAPSCPVKSNAPSGCVTGTKRSSLFGLNNLNEFIQPSRLPQNAPVLRVNFSNDPLNCTAICEGGNFDFCQVFAPDGARIAQLAEFEDLVKERNGGSIAVSEMHTIFQIEEVKDTCERGPLRLSGGQVANTGPDRCTINASTRISSRPVNVDISIPASLRADIKSLSPAGVTVEFASESEAMSVRLSDEFLNDKWGGPIQLLSTNANGIFASTAKSCISIVR